MNIIKLGDKVEKNIRCSFCKTEFRGKAGEDVPHEGFGFEQKWLEYIKCPGCGRITRWKDNEELKQECKSALQQHLEVMRIWMEATLSQKNYDKFQNMKLRLYELIDKLRRI